MQTQPIDQRNLDLYRRRVTALRVIGDYRWPLLSPDEQRRVSWDAGISLDIARQTQGRIAWN